MTNAGRWELINKRPHNREMEDGGREGPCRTPGSKQPREAERQGKTKSKQIQDNKREAEAKREHMDGTHSRNLLNQILMNDFGKFSGREGKPGSSELPLRAPELWSFTFLNSPISSPQITSTVIRPRPLSPSRSCSRVFQERNFTHAGENKEGNGEGVIRFHSNTLSTQDYRKRTHSARIQCRGG